MGSDVSFKGSRTLLVSVIRLRGIMVASAPLYAIHRLCEVAPHITDDRLMCRVLFWGVPLRLLLWVHFGLNPLQNKSGLCLGTRGGRCCHGKSGQSNPENGVCLDKDVMKCRGGIQDTIAQSGGK